MEIEVLREEYQPIVKSDLEMAKRYAQNIQDQTTLDRASEYLIELKRRKRTIDDKLKPIIAEARKPWDSMRALLDELTEPLVRAEKEIIKPAISRYEVEEEKKRIAEQKRREAEFQKMEEDNRLKMASEMESAGFNDQAEELISQESEPIAVELEKTKTKGLSFSWRYWAEVKDKMKLIRAVADGKVPISAVEPNMMFLNSYARSMRDEFSIDGVELKKERKVSAKI